LSLASTTRACVRTADDGVPEGGATLTESCFCRAGMRNWVGMCGTSQSRAEDEERGDADDTPAAAAVVEGCLQEWRIDLLNERVVVLDALVGVELDSIDEQAGHDPARPSGRTAATPGGRRSR